MDEDRTLDIMLDAASAAEAAEFERLELLEKIASLEKRLVDLESSAVLSEPETRVKRVEVYVDQNGQEPTSRPGAKKEVTYQRERVYRRQTINEKIEDALEDAATHSVSVGVTPPWRPVCGAAPSGDIDPTHGRLRAGVGRPVLHGGIAQYTIFFADIVGLSGTPPDRRSRR